MKKLFTISSIFTLALFSQTTFAQEIKSEDKIEYKGDNVIKNSKEHTVTLSGNVMVKTKNFTVNKADKAFVDEKNNTITIYNPTDFKLISAKELSKESGSNKNVIVYNYKDETITL
jgi:lipopolysaccharide export system protein LptA